MGLYPEAKTSALDLLKKQSTIDQDLHNSSNRLKFSIASLLFDDQLPTNKKPITLDDYQKVKYENQLHHNHENNNCLDLSCFTCKPFIRDWLSWCNNQKQQQNNNNSNNNCKTIKEMNSLTLNNKLNSSNETTHQLNQNMNIQINQQIHLNQQMNSQLYNQLNQQITNQLPNRSLTSLANQLINSSPQIPSSIQLTSNVSTSSSSSHLSNNNKKNNNFNSTSVQRINSYLNSLNNNQTINKMAHQSMNNKKKRNRTIFTTDQLERLELEFERSQYMVGSERLSLAARLNLSEVQVKVWFQNRRIKQRRVELEKKQHII